MEQERTRLHDMLAHMKDMSALIVMQQQLENLKPTLFSAEDLPMLTKKILNHQRNNIALVDFLFCNVYIVNVH